MSAHPVFARLPDFEDWAGLYQRKGLDAPETADRDQISLFERVDAQARQAFALPAALDYDVPFRAALFLATTVLRPARHEEQRPAVAVYGLTMEELGVESRDAVAELLARQVLGGLRHLAGHLVLEWDGVVEVLEGEPTGTGTKWPIGSGQLAEQWWDETQGKRGLRRWYEARLLRLEEPVAPGIQP